MKILLIILTALSSFLTSLETKTLESDFTLSIAADASQPINHTGSIIMHGKSFRLSVFDMQAAYDGKTLYIYQEDTDELTLSTPTEQDLLETNPFLYAKALSAVCNVTERRMNDNKMIITLTPKDQTVGIQRFTLTIDENNLPVRLEIKEGKKTTSLILRNTKYLTSGSESDISYQLTQQDFPTAYVNDIR